MEGGLIIPSHVQPFSRHSLSRLAEGTWYVFGMLLMITRIFQKTGVRQACGVFLILALGVTGQPNSLLAAESESSPAESILESGKKLYVEHCAHCHGKEGEGAQDEYDEPLTGDRSIKSLSGLIERTMPEDDPELVQGQDAARVAAYIFHEFYSPAAQAKRQPAPRIELSRLTVSQYRSAVADLIGSFPENDPVDAEANSKSQPGLAGQYFESKGMNKANELRFERTDLNIDFDFGEGAPSEDTAIDQFAVIWQGVLEAPSTGHYEFRVTTQNGVRLYLNAENTGRRRRMRDDSSVAGQAALIDGWVSSGKLTEHTARVFLLGGRTYPIRLEFFKYKEKTASIRLEWKPPHSVWANLDERFINTGSAPRTFVVTTPFPADDRSAGYERGSSVSPGWLDAITRGAAEAATEVVARLPYLAEYREGAKDRVAKMKTFLPQLASRAFRRTLTEEENSLFGNLLFEQVSPPETAVRRGLLLILTSPGFLYQQPASEDTAPDDFAVASRLALSLWDSLPDSKLLEAATQGALGTREQIQGQVDRMLTDERAKAKLSEFFHEWLEVAERDLSKDAGLYPEFSDEVVSDLRYSLDQQIEAIVWSPGSDYRDLMLTDRLYLNSRLKTIYQAPNTPSSESERITNFEPVSFTGQRAGILTHPFLLSAFAYHNTTSPIHRGVFLTRNVMGRTLKPPPEAVAFKNEDFPDDLTMREKITRLTRDAACMTCHSVINPLGFSLENFDAIGRYRTEENEEPIDSKAEYVTLEGDNKTFNSAQEIAHYAIASESAHSAFIAHLFRHLIKQTPEAFGRDTLPSLRLHFVEQDFNIRKLVAEIALRTATVGMKAE